MGQHTGLPDLLPTELRGMRSPRKTTRWIPPEKKDCRKLGAANNVVLDGFCTRDLRAAGGNEARRFRASPLACCETPAEPSRSLRSGNRDSVGRNNLRLAGEYLAAARVHEHLEPVDVICAVTSVAAERFDPRNGFEARPWESRKDLSIRR
jgi:hypothetical protein